MKLLFTALVLMYAPAYVYSDNRLLVNMTLVRNASLLGACMVQYISILFQFLFTIVLCACIKYGYIYGVDCLDGSLPAYHLHRGFGAGVNNWLLQFEVCMYVCLFN